MISPHGGKFLKTFKELDIEPKTVLETTCHGVVAGVLAVSPK